MNKHTFDAYGQYYDLLYKDKDYLSETNYIVETLKQHEIKKGSLLELGSGTGKHGRLLAEAGYQVHGIEQSAAMVAMAQQGNGFSCQQGDICEVRTGKKYDAVISLFHVVSYVTSNSNLRALFASVADHLKPGGLFIFDFWYSPAVCELRPTVRVKRMANADVEVMRIAEPEIVPNENIVNVHYTIVSKDLNSKDVGILNEVHSMRHFSLPEIDIFAECYGFIRVQAEEFLTRKSLGQHSWGACVILEKA